MPLPKDSNDLYFKPSPDYRKAWSVLPQVGLIQFDKKTKINSYNSSLDKIVIGLCVFLTLVAILIDAYVNFMILIKYGIKPAVLIFLVLADTFIPLIIYIFLEPKIIRLNNKIFQKELETTVTQINEDDRTRTQRIESTTEELKSFKSDRNWKYFFKLFCFAIICGIAAGKIITYASSLPPGINILSRPMGKVVFFGSIFCAFFHIFCTEKTFAYFAFLLFKQGEFKSVYQALKNAKGLRTPEQKLEYELQIQDDKPINYEANLIESRAGNTSVVKENNNYYIRYIHYIRDEEIKGLINAQTDDRARKAIAIKCKEIQVV